MDGYKTMHRGHLEYRADMLETIAGYQDADVARELGYALNTTTLDNTDGLRWLAALCERRIIDLEDDPRFSAKRDNT